MRKKYFQIGIIAILMILVSFTAFAAGVDETKEHYGWLSLIPPVLAILLAFITKQVLLSLFLGILSGVLILNNGNLFIAFLRTLDNYIVNSLADGWNAAIIIFTLSIGGMIGIIGKMGGTKAIAEWLAKKAKTSRSAQIVTALMGIFVFFDDYANTLIVGPTMRPLTDKLKVSREKLAYIVDSTAAPVVGLAFISTWVGYEIGLIGDEFANLGSTTSAFWIFIKSIPYTFYNIFAIVLVLTIAFTSRDFGPMYKAEKRARSLGKVLADDAKPMASDEITKMELKENIKLRPINAILPILVLIVTAFIGLWYNGYLTAVDEGFTGTWYSFEGIRESFGWADASVTLIWAAITASIVAGVLAISQKLLTLNETFDAWIEGSKALLITAVILVLAWSLGSVTDEIGTASFLIEKVGTSIPSAALPIVFFVLSCLVAFSTGTSWGTMAIVIPLAVPFATSYITGNPADAPIVIATLSSVLSGSIFGDHCSPISDTTIMSSMASGSDHIDHVKTQIPYALTGALFAIIGYLIIGLIPWKYSFIISLLVGIIGTIFFVRVFGKSVKEEDLIKEEQLS